MLKCFADLLFESKLAENWYNVYSFSLILPHNSHTMDTESQNIEFKQLWRDEYFKSTTLFCHKDYMGVAIQMKVYNDRIEHFSIIYYGHFSS